MDAPRNGLVTGERAAAEPGLVSRTLLRLLMKRASVAQVEQWSEHFRLITLEGPALGGVTWSPGQKIQIAMGSAFVARTYTPIDWDASAGRARILGFDHGDGPGSRWLRDVRAGDSCDIFGPRASLDTLHLTDPLVLFGDETSIGLAYALALQHRPRSFRGYFETTDPNAARDVVARLGIGNATLFRREDGDVHVDAMEAVLPALVADSCFVLTGKAGTIQRLRQALKRHGIPAKRIMTKAYWAPGKTGLD
jgi:NADPH-dependent ferric siderophore reductase